ncbi:MULTISPECIES: hypothetical protein [Pseudoalteromonas]|uniref:hypothetical protein n=1 Tax=Pseudoalteromonas TaxID=53246 RepID=UPI00110B0752|nr:MULTISPECIES: hypothetical protein [Pseudoalteromonas]MCG7545388.1 hypothetical protein [Pseudoalteromonas sp. MM17-2]TMO87668.1 hypothetical protein CWC12_10330 [Pseudoalteromonas ruthenica]TMP22255.1 hypothetical protein CWC06_15680 [Pseudoalteromonas ruthenica]
MAKLTKQQKRAAKKKAEKKKAAKAQCESNRATKQAYAENLNKLLPEQIKCNECGGRVPKSTYTILPTQDVDGVDLAFSGTCDDCGSATMALSGEPEACAVVHEMFMSEMDGSKWSMQKHSLGVK